MNKILKFVKGLGILIGFIYFLPYIHVKGKKNARAIFIFNLLLGWTFIGWIIALVWALKVDPDKK